MALLNGTRHWVGPLTEVLTRGKGQGAIIQQVRLRAAHTDPETGQTVAPVSVVSLDREEMGDLLDILEKAYANGEPTPEDTINALREVNLILWGVIEEVQHILDDASHLGMAKMETSYYKVTFDEMARIQKAFERADDLESEDEVEERFPPDVQNEGSLLGADEEDAYEHEAFMRERRERYQALSEDEPTASGLLQRSLAMLQPVMQKRMDDMIKEMAEGLLSEVLGINPLKDEVWEEGTFTGNLEFPAEIEVTAADGTPWGTYSNKSFADLVAESVVEKMGKRWGETSGPAADFDVVEAIAQHAAEYQRAAAGGGGSNAVTEGTPETE